MSIELPPDMVDLDAVVEHPKILIFSRPKAGKTTLSASDDDVLILNAEAQGTISAKRSKTLGHNVKQWDCTKWEGFDKAVEWLEECNRKHGQIPLKWVVVDTITTLQDRVLMRFILNEVHAKNPSKRSLYIPDKPEYLRNQLMLVEYIKRLNDLPVNVLYNAHIMEKSDQEGNSFYYPQIQGGDFKIAQAILAMMTSYGFMYKKPRMKDGKRLVDSETKKRLFDYFIQWDDEGKMQGGDRLNIFGSTTKNVTLKQLRQRIEATNRKVNDGSDQA